MTADLGYGVPLAQVFTGRAFEAARSGHGGVTATQPPEAARLKALEVYLRSVPDNGHHPL